MTDIYSDIGFPRCNDRCRTLDNDAAMRECEERRYAWLSQSNLDEVLPQLTDKELAMALGSASHLWLHQAIEWRVNEEIFRRLGQEALEHHLVTRERLYGPNPRPRGAGRILL